MSYGRSTKPDVLRLCKLVRAHWLRLPLLFSFQTQPHLHPLLSFCSSELQNLTQPARQSTTKNNNTTTTKHGCKSTLKHLNPSYSLRYALLLPHLQPLHHVISTKTGIRNTYSKQSNKATGWQRQTAWYSEQITDDMSSSHKRWPRHRLPRRRRRAVEVAEHHRSSSR